MNYSQSCNVKRKLFFSPVKDAAAPEVELGILTCCRKTTTTLPTCTKDIDFKSLAQRNSKLTSHIGTDPKADLENTNTEYWKESAVVPGVPQNADFMSHPVVLLQAPELNSVQDQTTKNIDLKLSENKKIYPSHHKIYEAKLALNSGREHVTPKGKVRRARDIKPPCKDDCKRCEKPKLILEERLSINEEFWSLEDHLQWQYIKKSLEVAAPKRKSASAGSKGEKNCSRVYSFSINGGHKRVCKTMFRATLSICDSWIDSAISHCSGSAVHQDKRGRHNNRPKRKSSV